MCVRASRASADRLRLHESHTATNKPGSDRGVTTMEVILLERIGKLGQMGDVVRVKDGFARNFLLPRGKALRATADNKKRFEEMKSDLQARNLEMKGEAGKIGSKLNGKTYVVLRQASESGQLFGSVSTRDIAALIKADGAEVGVGITVPVARSADEAERLARGEDVTVRRTEAEEESAAAAAAAEALFDPEAVKAARGEEGAEGDGAAKQAGAQPGDAPAKATKGKRKKKTKEA